MQPGVLTQDFTETSVGMERGILIGVIAHSPGESTEPVSTWVEIGVARSENPIDPIALLASGYITVLAAVGWTGRFELGPDTFLYCRAAGITTEELQIGFTIYQP